MCGLLCGEPEPRGPQHESLVQQVKDRQRASETAGQAWKSYCDSRGEGVRDPRLHGGDFLRDFLLAYAEGRLMPTSGPEAAELIEVTSSEPALGSRQIKLRMPSSEAGIMKEVVTTNAYNFLPGRTCVLREGDVVLDVGAHVGIVATLALYTKDVSVVCVEPHPVTFDILRLNLSEHGERATLINMAVADAVGSRPLYAHRGTNNPSRLFFSSLFDTRRHAEATICTECATLQGLVNSHNPTVIKIDAEGAERFLSTVLDFRSVRLVVAEWDWTHNRLQSTWLAVKAHLCDHGFAVAVRGRMPSFDETGHAELHSASGKKRGNTGMIFVASRKAGTQAPRPQCGRRGPPVPVGSTDGCPVGALVCDVADLGRVFDACRVRSLARQKGAVKYGGRMALHLTLEGATLLSAGEAPPEVKELLDEGRVTFVQGLRKGTRSQAYRGPSARREAPAQDPSFRFVDLFAGIGGFRRGLEPLGGQCVFTSEIDTDCQETYALNFGGENLFGDITCIDTQDFPEHDILTAGFPCQPFARRGERLGFGACDGGLFHEIPRVLRARRPAGFLLENVWNLQFIDGGQWDKDEKKCVYGNTFKHILDCLREAGYVVQARVLLAQGWVAQDRKRLYIVGFRDDLAEKASKLFEWPEPPGGGVVRDVLFSRDSAEAKSCELTEHQWAAVQRSSTWESGGERLRFANLDGVACTLTASYKSSFATVAELVSPADTGLERPRFFTRRECARLMGFGEDHLLGNAASPNRAYHQLGNAVCPPLIEAVARNLGRSLGLVPSGENVAADAGERQTHKVCEDERRATEGENAVGQEEQEEEAEEEKPTADEAEKREKENEAKAEKDQEEEHEADSEAKEAEEQKKGWMQPERHDRAEVDAYDREEAERDEEKERVCMRGDDGEGEAEIGDGSYEYLATVGAQPALRAQLDALTVEQMASRLETFGVLVRQPSPEEFVRGFKAARRAELLDALCAEYAARVDSQPRRVLHGVGVLLPDHAAKQLLEALRMMSWTENVRPAVHASGYVVLKRPHEVRGQPRWREDDPRAVRRRVWELSEALLRAASTKAANFHFTAIAVSKNFRGSPHVDKNDISVQYALSLGEFGEGGGRLCVEEDAFVVRALETRGRLVCFDGRFPHWVSGYVGERYSVIFYRSFGEEDPSVRAVHEV